jgi:hypothetical protein
MDKLTVEEGAWFRTLLALDFEDEQHRKKIKELLGVPKFIRSSLEYWPDFSFRLNVAKDNRPENALWLYSEDSGSAYNAALLVRTFLAEFRPGEIKQFSVAYTCSKPMLDGFGGETYVVSAQNIYCDACVANTIAKAIETGQQQKMALAGLDIIVRPKKGKRP